MTFFFWWQKGINKKIGPKTGKFKAFLKSRKTDGLSLIRVAGFYVEKRRLREDLEQQDNEFEHFYVDSGGQ